MSWLVLHRRPGAVVELVDDTAGIERIKVPELVAGAKRRGALWMPGGDLVEFTFEAIHPQRIAVSINAPRRVKIDARGGRNGRDPKGGNNP